MGDEEEQDRIEDNYGSDDYPDTQRIFDFAPKIKSNDWEPRTLRRACSQDCLIHGPKWHERVKEIMELFLRLDTNIAKIKLMETGLCSCGGKAAGQNMPSELLHKNTWELHLFFQNGLNHLTRDNDDEFSSKLRNTLSEILQECLTYNDSQRYLFLKWIRAIILFHYKMLFEKRKTNRSVGAVGNPVAV